MDMKKKVTIFLHPLVHSLSLYLTDAVSPSVNIHYAQVEVEYMLVGTPERHTSSL